MSTRHRRRSSGGARKTNILTKKAALSAAKIKEAIEAASAQATGASTAASAAISQITIATEALESTRAAAATAVADCNTAIGEIEKIRKLNAREATTQSQHISDLIQRAIRAVEMSLRYANRAKSAYIVAAESAKRAETFLPEYRKGPRFSLKRLFAMGSSIEAVKKLNNIAIAHYIKAVDASEKTAHLSATASQFATDAKQAGARARAMFDDAMNTLIEKWEDVAVQAEEKARHIAAPGAAIAASNEVAAALQMVEALTHANLGRQQQQKQQK